MLATCHRRALQLASARARWQDDRMARLSVNLNKIAVLRNSRGGALPSVIETANVVLAAGARGLTVHPRPDQRHIRPGDVYALSTLLQSHRAESAPIEFNIEGNPFAPANAAGYPGLIELVQQTRPDQVTLVPDADGQLTSDHGFDLSQAQPALRTLIAQCHDAGARVSLFVDADSRDIARAAEYGADRIEIYTGPFAAAVHSGDFARAVEDCLRVAEQARAAGLGINAGHDLDLHNLPVLLRALPDIAEVSIGHALVNDALYAGLAATVAAYLQACRVRS
jgi:pyridoxine 5-phosphate synthase